MFLECMPRQLFYSTMLLLLHLLSLSAVNIPGTDPKSQPFHSPRALRSSLAQPCTLTQGCAAVQLGFPTSCLHRHVGAPIGWYPNVTSFFVIFWIFWSKMKVTQADAPTIWMDHHPNLTNWCPTSSIPIIFTPDALPGTTLPIYSGLEQAPNMLACVPGVLLSIDSKQLNDIHTDTFAEAKVCRKKLWNDSWAVFSNNSAYLVWHAFYVKFLELFI